MIRFLLVLICASVPSLCLGDAAANRLTEAEKKAGWQLAFDGESFSGWRNYRGEGVSDGWQIRDGAIVRVGKAGDLMSDRQYDQFEISLEYKISRAGNSGLMFHVTEDNPAPWHSGPEVQIQDNVDGYDPQKSGWLYQLYKPYAAAWRPDAGEIMDATRPAGEWNQLYLRVADSGGEVCLNGVHYYRFQLGSKDWNARVAQSKFKKFPDFGKAGGGHIVLQDHGDEVAFRSIKIREIADDGSVPQPIDGNLDLVGEPAFPNLVWEDWEPYDDAGQVRPLRIIELTYPDDGGNRLYAVSQQGGIWSFENRRDVKESRLLLDLRGEVYDWTSRGANEQGLLGLAFHPQFRDNGFFFVLYSHPTELKTVVSRFRVSEDDPLVADRDSEVVILENEKPYQNHNAGAIEFGPDGYLYVTFGDGGSLNDPHDNGQNLGTLLGSIARIDVDRPDDGKPYGIPSDNPFINVDGARPEIYAYGFRNPWRIAFDEPTGRLWMSDVGQDLLEEINIVEKGGNYGWNRREGSYLFGNRDQADLGDKVIEPVWEYDHQIGKSITGGRVYRSDRLPQLYGKYLYADYVSGRVWALGYDEATGMATTNEQVLARSIPVLAFGQDRSGEVYYSIISTSGQCLQRFVKP